MGHIEEDLADQKTRQHVLDLLAGKAPSPDPQGEAYRMLLVASCNHWHRAMPFLFQRIDDYTELPHWIVRYLVENSLGRLWLLNRPNSRLAERMDYYIKPEPQMNTDRHGLEENKENICVHLCESV